VVWSELFTADCINAERQEKSKNQSDIDCVQHNLVLGDADAMSTVRHIQFLSWVNLRPRTSRIRGSPFQLPTRLAVGLGLESGLETGCPASCAPSSTLRILGLPHPAPGRKPDFGCNGKNLITTAGSCQNKNGAPCQTPHKYCTICRKYFLQSPFAIKLQEQFNEVSIQNFVRDYFIFARDAFRGKFYLPASRYHAAKSAA